MNFEQVINAAKASIPEQALVHYYLQTSGHRDCPLWKFSWIRDRSIESAIEEIQWYQNWADGRNDLEVVTGNWNTVDTYDRRTKKRVDLPGGDIMRRLSEIFESMGADIDWCDQVTGCGGCCKAIQTQPDCYGWIPEFVVSEGDITCTACMDDGGWQEELDQLCHCRGEL